jgi:hypothetical protein
MADAVKPLIITGLPSGVKEPGQRVDFRPESFHLAIQTKGYRLWWSRSAACPCKNNTQTRQPSTTCALCKGQGYFTFLPEIGLENYAQDAYGNPIQLNQNKDAVLIRGIMTQATQDPQIFERFGEWVFGTIRVTVQPENKLSYWDRLTCVDAVMAWSQIIEADGSAFVAVTGGVSGTSGGLRYPAVTINLLRSVERIYEQYIDYMINETGGITWVTTAPSDGTLLSIHYTIHPVFRVLDHVYAFRNTLVSKKRQATDDAAQVTELPIHAMAKLDFLIND